MQAESTIPLDVWVTLTVAGTRLVCVRGPSPSGRRCRRRWLGGAWTVVAAGYAKRTGHGATPHTASLRCLRSARTSTYDYPLDYLLELR